MGKMVKLANLKMCICREALPALSGLLGFHAHRLHPFLGSLQAPSVSGRAGYGIPRVRWSRRLSAEVFEDGGRASFYVQI